MSSSTSQQFPILPALHVAALDYYTSPQPEAAIRLNTNESPLPPPADFIEELKSLLPTVSSNRYPDRYVVKLRQALAEFHDVEPQQIFCAKGSNEVLQCLIMAFGGRGRRVVTFEPTYPMHSHIARICATEVVSAKRKEDFTLDLNEVTRVFLKFDPSISFLCSPNNPTGISESRSGVEKVLECAPGLVILDEAYVQFASGTEYMLNPDSNLTYSKTPSMVDKLVRVRTFSKTWAMAGWRLGYMIAPSYVVDACFKVALPYHMDALSQLAGLVALKYVSQMEQRVDMIVKERTRVKEELDKLPLQVWPSEANFILFKSLAVDGTKLWEALLRRSVLIRDCSTWNQLQGFLRVTVGTREENDTFLAAMKDSLGELEGL
ncbi:MAG: histidinol-phosphate transaminase [Actinobacteria bacterium]|nr:histidinol-phosphate transaminase [Actinomycetota bacterium]MCL6105499.1 histidinol-phosphate transaminase [Actinomycetota bacterium]